MLDGFNTLHTGEEALQRPGIIITVARPGSE